MRSWLYKLLVTWNIIAFVAFLIFVPYSHFEINLRIGMRITELDRENVLDEEELDRAFPELADLVRSKVTQWISANVLPAMHVVITFGLVTACTNLCALSFLRQKEIKQQLGTTVDE